MAVSSLGKRGGVPVIAREVDSTGRTIVTLASVDGPRMGIDTVRVRPWDEVERSRCVREHTPSSRGRGKESI